MRIAAMATDSWRQDEFFTYSLSLKTPTAIVEGTARDVHPPLSYLIFHAWLRVFPNPEHLKILTLSIGLLTLLSMMMIARVLHGTSAAIFTGLFLAGFPQFIHFAQEVRMYCPALLFESIAILGLLLRARSPIPAFILFVGGMVCAIYTHNYSLLFCAAVTLFVWANDIFSIRSALSKQSSGYRSLIWVASASALIGLLYLPWLPTTLRQLSHPVLDTVYAAPGVVGLLHGWFVETMAVYEPGVLAWIAALLSAPILIVFPFLFLIGERARAEPASDAPSLPATSPLVVLVPTAIALVLSVFALRGSISINVPKHGMVFTPFGIIATGCLLARFATSPSRKKIVLFGLMIFLAFSLIQLGGRRNFDQTGHIDLLVEKGRPGQPYMVFPRHEMSEGFVYFWEGLEDITPLMEGDYPYPTRFNLVVKKIKGSDMHDQIGRSLAQDCTISELHNAENILLYDVRCKSPDAVRHLYEGGQALRTDHYFQPPHEVRKWQDGDLSSIIVGDHIAQRAEWSVGHLTQLVVPVDRQGLGISLPLPEQPGSGPMLTLYEFRTVGSILPISLSVTSSEGLSEDLEFGHRRFHVARIGNPGHSSSEIAFLFDTSDGRTDSGSQGGKKSGNRYYLSRVLEGPLNEQLFRHPQGRGIWIDVGSASDFLFVREGFLPRETLSTNSARWTRQQFSLQVPVPDLSPDDQIILSGIIPQQLPGRHIRMTLRDASSGESEMETRVALPEVAYTDHVIPCSSSVGAGVKHVEFELEGEWIPSEHGAGDDDRSLGAFINALQIVPKS